MVKVFTGDEVVVEVPKKVALEAGVIANMLADIGDMECSIPLPNVHSKILKYVFDFCAFHLEHPEIDISTYYKNHNYDNWNEFDLSLCKSNESDVPAMILASEYMQTLKFSSVLTSYVANRLSLGNCKDKDSTEKVIFGEMGIKRPE